MLRAIIIDDEKDSIEALLSLIKLCHIPINVIGTGYSVADAIREITQKKPELVFLDIRLGDEISFTIFDTIKDIDFQVIFISAYNEFVFQAFKYSAVDYLLKPIDTDELVTAVNRAGENHVKMNMVFNNLRALITNINAPKPYMLSIPTADGLEFIDINEIANIEADGSYSLLYLQNNTHFFVCRSIGEFQDQLPDAEFCRVHNSHLINLKFVKKLNRKGGLEAELTRGVLIPIARNRKDIFMKKFENFTIVL